MSDSTQFRPLNENEKAAIYKAVSRERIVPEDPRFYHLEALEVSYEFMQGGFCICLLKLRLNRLIFLWRGASRRSYKDARKPIRGQMIAFSRAVWYSRRVEV